MRGAKYNNATVTEDLALRLAQNLNISLCDLPSLATHAIWTPSKAGECIRHSM